MNTRIRRWASIEGALVVVALALACSAEAPTATLVPTAAPTTAPALTPTAPPTATATPMPTATPTVRPEQTALDAATDRWDRAGITNYDYIGEWVCHPCPWEWAQKVRVSVQGGEIVSMTFMDPDIGDVPDPVRLQYRTIDGLFAHIQEVLGYRRSAVSVTYHGEYGYPRKVSINYDVLAIDGSASFTISEFSSR